MLQQIVDLVGSIICIRRASRYLEEKYFKGFGGKNIGICNDRGIDKLEKRIWRMRWQDNEGDKVKESRTGE